MVSIVVPVYNAARYIRKTIDMVCEQTYKDWELILVDDASADNSAEIISDIIESSGKRIRLIRKERNAGAAEAIGLTRSRRKFWTRSWKPGPLRRPEWANSHRS